jgi:hypothetical protein
MTASRIDGSPFEALETLLPQHTQRSVVYRRTYWPARRSENPFLSLGRHLN